MNPSTPAAPAHLPTPLSSPEIRLTEFAVPLPGALQAFGSEVQASLCGQRGAPLVVMLGGISADRFPCTRPDGRPGWWAGLAGTGAAVDPASFQILGLDFAADENGRQAPSTRDQAEVVCAALRTIGTTRALAVIGASYGGMTVLALGEHFPQWAERLVVISAPGEPHPYATAMRELQRRAAALGIEADRGQEGLSIARGLAMLSYRTPEEFAARFAGGISGARASSGSEPGAYLRARGLAYRDVMSPERFLSLSASIDRHRVAPERIALPTLLIGALSDQLVPSAQLFDLARRLAGPSCLHLLPSAYGHDMFLKQTDQLSEIIAPFLRTEA